jgi:surface polysaccharide O-acyltransferase-like enzyme
MTWELSDLLRAIATTIVIGIHASHHWWFGIKDVSTINPEIFFSTFINQVGRFTVPIFVVLSGFALAKSEEKRPFVLQVFIQRRLWRIVPPYILFTLLNVVGRSQFLSADWLGRGEQVWQALATGMGDYHLYFLGIIFQCYVIYPLLRRFNFSVLRMIALIVMTFSLFSLRWSTAIFGFLPELSPYLANGNHLVYWLSYFQIGIWLAKDHGWTNLLVSKWRSRIWGYLLAIAAILALSEFYWIAILKNSGDAAGHYTRPTVVLLSLTFLLWSISWQNWQNWQTNTFAQPLPNIWKSIQSHIKTHIQTFSNASFITYLIHVWILRAIAPLEILGAFIYIPLASIISWLGGFLVWKIIKKY